LKIFSLTILDINEGRKSCLYFLFLQIQELQQVAKELEEKEKEKETGTKKVILMVL